MDVHVEKQVAVPTRNPTCDLMELEAPPGFEPGVEVLQTSALPLGDGAPKRLAGLPFDSAQGIPSNIEG